MNKSKFAMALHFHQPEGNFGHVFENAYRDCYLPIIKTLNDFPQIKTTLHYSGSLLEWMAEKQPKFFDKISKMARRGQVELMTGGFYEPILPAIPYQDRIGQIVMLTNFLQNKFNCEIKGAWVAERVWEPDLVPALQEAGVKYIILDDTHLIRAGIKKGETYGYYITQKNNRKTAVFASDKKLRYSIPFKSAKDTIDYFKNTSQKIKSPLFMYADDGEKFGVWPGTNALVYKRKWLAKFFNQILKNNDWLETVTLSEYMKEQPALGKTHIPAASYEEMMEWSAIDKPLGRSNSWNNFFVKYPESNHMHKKMLYVGRKIDNLIEPSIDREKLSEARRHLYKGQCNCAYWHGLFGGIYLHHLRQSLYKNLIKAEVIVDESSKVPNKNRISIFDFDNDKKDEIIAENNILSAYIDPAKGGMITELDYKPKFHNFINTFSRKKEDYHKAIKTKLSFDNHRRGCLIDRVFKDNISVAKFMSSSYREIDNLTDKVYKYKVYREGKNSIIHLESKADISGNAISIVKKIALAESIAPELKIDYIITNLGLKEVNFSFGSEFNITMPNGPSPQYLYTSSKPLTTSGKAINISKFGIIDKNKYCNILLEFDKKTSVLYAPVYTISKSEKKLEKTYQCSALLPYWKLSLQPGQEWNITIRESS